VTCICAKRGQLYFIFDNGHLTVHHGTLEEFREKHYPTMVTYHYARWFRCKQTLLGGLSMHARGVSEEEFVEHPEMEMHAQPQEQPLVIQNISQTEAKNSNVGPNIFAAGPGRP
jgi:hypothetical protein